MALTSRLDAVAARLAAADRPDRPDRPDQGGDGRLRPAGSDIDPRLRDRLRTAVCCLALTVMVTSTRPGRVLADTKIDMAVNPIGFLGRALHLWDPAQFGQLQNQAAGYFFPMGPFYAIGDLIGLPAWITQRLWMAALLCAAFLGVQRLAERLGLGGPISRAAGGMAYALGPHGVSALGQNSWEYLPLAMLPWIVLPLVTAVRDGAPIRGAARSGVAVALCGGINATATAAVLVVPVIYVLTRPRGTPKIRLLACWSAAVGCAVVWWLVPLLLTGRYAFSWLGHTEKADTTTGTTGLVDVLRGAERWINYLDASSLPVGHALSTQAPLIVVTAALAALGLAGLVRLARGGPPERGFLVLTLLAGVAIVAAGHVSGIEGPQAAAVRDLLDGPLAPLRNLHKFDGLVRLPLALGVVHLLASVRRPRARLNALAATAVTLAAVAAPALVNGLAGPGDFPAVPRYWKDAAAWLNGRAGEQAVLALPGARFGEYTWGRPMDDIMQPLLSSRWGARQLVPQGSPGYARLMDAIDQRAAAGRGSPGLTEVLARMGVRYVLVRNDLSRADLRGAWPGRVHETLDTSPGIKRVASFGARPVGGTWADEAVGSFDQPYPPLEVYEVADADDVVSLLDAGRALRMSGAPEGMLGLADAGLLRGRPVLLGDGPGDAVVSDSLRRRQRGLGEIRSQISPTLTADHPLAGNRGLGTDPAEDRWRRDQTVVAYEGVAKVSASSSAADPGSIQGLDDPGALPYAALDGDPATRWMTGGWRGPAGQWLKVDFTRPREPGGLGVSFARNDFLGPPPSRIAVETERGAVEQDVRPVAGDQRLRAPPGPTRWLRVRVLALARRPAEPAAARVALSDLRIDGVRATRYLRPPAPSGRAAYAFDRGDQARPACMRGSTRWVCTPELARADEEGDSVNRIFAAASGGPARITGTAVLTDPARIDRLTRQGSPVTVTASSTWTEHPAGLPRAVLDGDRTTTWASGGDDRGPTLDIKWGYKIPVSELTVARPPGAAPALRVTVRAPDGEVREGLVDRNGRLGFRPLQADRLTLTFSSSQTPLQISDVIIPSTPTLPSSGFKPAHLPCGSGPRLTLNGTEIKTRVTSTVDAILGGRAMRYQSCGNARLAAGDNRLTAGGAYRVQSAVVDPGGRLAAAPKEATEQVRVRSWGRGARSVDVDAPNASYLVVNENYNAGWRAHVGGRTLRPVKLDGWRQAWEVPAGTTGAVRLDYKPDAVYRLALLAGLALLPILLLTAAWPRRATGSAGSPRPAPPALWLGRLCPVPAAALGFWIAGPPGLAVTTLTAVLTLWAQSRTGRPARILASPWTAAALMLLAATFVATATWLALHQATDAPLLQDTIPQLLALTALARLTVALAPVPPPAVQPAPLQPTRRQNARWAPPRLDSRRGPGR